MSVFAGPIGPAKKLILTLGTAKDILKYTKKELLSGHWRTRCIKYINYYL